MKRKHNNKAVKHKDDKRTKNDSFTVENVPPSENPLKDLLGSLKSSRHVLKKILIAESGHEKCVSMTNEGEVENEEDENESDEQDEDEEHDEDDDEDDLTNIMAEYEDPFKNHFEVNIPLDFFEKIPPVNDPVINAFADKYSSAYTTHSTTYGVDSLHCTSTQNIMKQAGVKTKLSKEWFLVNKTKANKKGHFTPLQQDIFKSMAVYKDFLFYDRNFKNGEEIRRLYCLHALNHVLKTRSRIVKNNIKISSAEKVNKETDDCRDQGLTRPKVLIIVPFKDSCMRIVKVLLKLNAAGSTKVQVMQKKRFMKEFSKDPDEKESKSFQTEDFKETFAGNIDDDFKIGVAIAKNTVKLYAPFYAADVIIASPLSLRRIIGSSGEKQDYDFLSSIELLVMDQMDIFNMQNWEHVLHVLDYMHRTPRESHDTDFSRVRMWCVEGCSKFYRQSLLFSNQQSARVNSIFNKYCFNFNGKMKVSLKHIDGTIEQVAIQTPQVFHRFPCSSYTDAADKRFEYFIYKILPEFKGQLCYSTAIFIPSYFDFVRVRNYFKKEEMSFVQISEYSNRANISRSRMLFTEKRKQFLLFTERFHFFYRYRIRGVKHLIFYDLPQYAAYYPEFINFMTSADDGSPSCSIVYSGYDGYRLEAITGSERCKQMMTSQKNIHMIVSGENS